MNDKNIIKITKLSSTVTNVEKITIGLIDIRNTIRRENFAGTHLRKKKYPDISIIKPMV